MKPHRLEFISHRDFDSFKFKLLSIVPQKFAKLKWLCKPPVEFKSSKYRIWFNTELISPEPGWSLSGYVIYFRDEEDYLLATLLK